VKTIEAVPESLTREQYVSLIRSVGFETKYVRKLEFRMDGIYAEVYDHHEDGAIRIHKDADDAVINTVWIPVADELPDDD
jgi:hypothetical protein